MNPPEKIYLCKNVLWGIGRIDTTRVSRIRIEEDDECYVRQHSELKKLEKWIKNHNNSKSIQTCSAGYLSAYMDACQDILEQIKQMRERI
jgi:hypothetical protein